MLFNAEDIQGGLRVKKIAKRGAQKKSSFVKLDITPEENQAH
jgi:hypothetical protein